LGFAVAAFVGGGAFVAEEGGEGIVAAETGVERVLSVEGGEVVVEELLEGGEGLGSGLGEWGWGGVGVLWEGLGLWGGL
jgi:hypothetical protein